MRLMLVMVTVATRRYSSGENDLLGKDYLASPMKVSAKERPTGTNIV